MVAHTTLLEISCTCSNMTRCIASVSANRTYCTNNECKGKPLIGHNKSKEEGIYQESIQVPYLSQETTWEVTKTQENITHMRAKRLVFSQQVTTRLQ